MPTSAELLDMQLYDDITLAFGTVMSSDGMVDAVKFGQTAMLIAPLYDRIFGPGMLANHLKNDLIGHGSGLANAAAKDLSKYRFVNQMVPTLLRERGSTDLRGEWGNGVIECLWTKRALDFIVRFLDYGILSHTEKTLHECAAMAYNEVLRPHHGIMVSKIVSLAFKLAPHRDAFLKALGFSDIAKAQTKLVVFLRLSRPVLDKVHDILELHGVNTW